jgi:hypothetical protein
MRKSQEYVVKEKDNRNARKHEIMKHDTLMEKGMSRVKQYIMYNNKMDLFHDHKTQPYIYDCTGGW